MFDQKLIMEINKALWNEFADTNEKLSNSSVLNSLDPVCDDDRIKVTWRPQGEPPVLIYEKIMDDDTIKAGIQFQRNMGHDQTEAMEIIARLFALETIQKSIQALKGYAELQSVGKEFSSLQEEKEDLEKDF